MRIEKCEFVMRKIVLASLVLWLLVPVVEGRQSFDFDLARLSDKGREAYARLQSATMFRLGPVGFTGETSAEELALQSLLSEGDGLEALQSLCRSATAAGSLYGLMGLRKRDIRVFEKELQLYRDRSTQIDKSSQPTPPEQIEKSPSPRSFPDRQAGTGTILTQQGCLVIPEQQESILRRLESGSYDVGYAKITPPK